MITRVSTARNMSHITCRGDILLYNVLAARDNLKIITRVPSFEPETVPAPIALYMLAASFSNSSFYTACIN